MGTILLTADYPSILTKLGIDTSDLSNADIDSLGVLPAAEAVVIDVLPGWASLTGVNLAFVKAGTVALTAAFAVRGVQVHRGQSFHQAEYSESATQADWSETRKELIAEAQGWLQMVDPTITIDFEDTRLHAGVISLGLDFSIDEGLEALGEEDE